MATQSSYRSEVNLFATRPHSSPLDPLLLASSAAALKLQAESGTQEGSQQSSQRKPKDFPSSDDDDDHLPETQVETQQTSPDQRGAVGWHPAMTLLRPGASATLSDQSSQAFDSQAILNSRYKGWLSSSQGTEDSTDTAVSSDVHSVGPTTGHGKVAACEYYDNPLMSLADAAKQESLAREKEASLPDATVFKHPAAPTPAKREPPSPTISAASYQRASVDAGRNPVYDSTADAWTSTSNDRSTEPTSVETHDDVDGDCEDGKPPWELADADMHHEDSVANAADHPGAGRRGYAPAPAGYAYTYPYGYTYASAYQAYPYSATSGVAHGSVQGAEDEDVEGVDEMDADGEEAEDEDDEGASSGPSGSPPAAQARAQRRITAAEKRKKAVASIEATANVKQKGKKKKKSSASTGGSGGVAVSAATGKKAVKRHRCDECGKGFDRAFNLSQHLQATHRNIRNCMSLHDAPPRPC